LIYRVSRRRTGFNFAWKRSIIDTMNAASQPSTPPDSSLIERFAKIVGDRYALRHADEINPYLIERRDLFHGQTSIVLRPGTVDEVAAVIRLANETRTPVVPQGGNTGLVGGQVPDASGTAIILSLSRLDKVRSVDPEKDAMIAEAGVILADAQAAADAADRLFPLSLASEGSCEIGGNVSTNAGGTAVLAYGNTRELVLGLEVVLASGEIWNGLRTLRKDNTGYDLKNLFIGAEGTLGIVTTAALKLFPKPRGLGTALIGLASPEAALAVLHRAKAIAGHALTSFELMSRRSIDFVLAHLPGSRDPLAGQHDWYVLLEVSSGRSDTEARDLVEAIFVDASEAGLVEDGMMAETIEQARALWDIRHAIPDMQGFEGGSIKHDVSVPVDAMPELIARGIERVTAMIPGIRPVPFGHVGDGNIHFNFTQPEGMDKAAFLARWEEVNAAVHEIVGELGGSISAEHGIGQLKRALLPQFKSAVEIDLMRKIKATLDPNGILNPGKVL
jgi:FAD/FMN-containing dehydrogenase